MKLIKPTDYAPGSSRYQGHNPGYNWLREWWLNKKYRYWYLICDHITDWYEQERCSVWSPGKGKFWCEECGKWRKARPPIKYPQPTEPLF